MGSLLVCFETGSFQVAQPDLELKAVLSQFPDCSELQMWATILSSSSLISCFMFKSLISLVFFHLSVFCAIWIQFCLFLELIQLSKHQYFYSYYLSVWWCFFHLRSWGFSLCYICRLSPMLFPLIPSLILFVLLWIYLEWAFTCENSKDFRNQNFHLLLSCFSNSGERRCLWFPVSR